MSRAPIRVRGKGLAWGLTAFLASLAGAAQPSASVRAEECAKGPPLTALAAEALGRASHVVVGDVVSLNESRGVAIARVAVTRWLKGHADAAEISVLGGAALRGSLAERSGYQSAVGTGPRGEPWSTGPALKDRPGTSYLLFLSQRTSGVAFALENRIELRGLDSLEKIAAIEAQIGLAGIADPDGRGRRVLAHFLDALKTSGAWTRANAARELNYLAGVKPALFDARTRARIRHVLDGPAAPAVKTWLRSLESRLGADPGEETFAPPAPEPPPARPTAPRDPAPASFDVADRIAALDDVLTNSGDAAPARALILFRDAQEAVLKAWIVDWLAESGHASALPALRNAYAREEDPDVREALVRATGLLGTDADVPWLVERLKNPRLVDFVVVALARIRTPAALEALRSLAAHAAVSARDEERDLAVRIEHVLGPAFEEAERTSGHTLGPERK